jgi:V8-like Glu-specific endopeptidase
MKPVDVNTSNESELWLKQNNDIKKGEAKYKVGDNVRISRLTNSPFIKNFDNNWSDEIFTISNVDTSRNITMYTIQDYEKEVLNGRFYTQELQVVTNPSVYRISHIIRTEGVGKNKRYYVKWHGYAKPGYVLASELI